MIHVKGLWSLAILNFRPYKYGLKRFIPQTIASNSFSLVESFFSAGVCYWQIFADFAL
jgi:hypothetical protein